MSNQTVTEKALLLAAEARRIGVSQSEEEATVAVTTRINDLLARLGDLRTVVDASRRLNNHGAQIPLDKVDDGLAVLRKRSGNGVPPPKALNGAIDTVTRVGSEIGDLLLQGWRSWCDERMAELRRDRMVMLESGDATAAEAAMKDLEKLRRDKPRAAAVTQFMVLHDGLREKLDSALDPEPELVELLRRLKAGTTLSRLTPDDLRLLYERGLADSVEVRRRTS